MAGIEQIKSNEDKFFELIAQGVDYSTLCTHAKKFESQDGKLIATPVLTTFELQRGIRSENKAQIAIDTLDIIQEAILTPRNSYFDAKLIDLMVYMKPIQPIKTVAVQIKSSAYMISEKLKEIQRKHSFTDQKLKAWLAKRRLIFICGSDTPTNIQQEFIDKYQKLQQELSKIQPEPTSIKATQILHSLKKSRQAIIYNECIFKRKGDEMTCTMEVKLYDGRKLIFQGVGLGRNTSANDASAKVLELLQQEGLLG